MKNSEIRQEAKSSGVFLYEVASRLHISEPTMTRLMRNELEATKRCEILAVIAELAAEKTAAKNEQA